ncbi:MAG: type III pantothenate kinase [Alistipes sp.]|nr:type III pantothenate kinase [Alistipes senegalensis]MCM1250954.1 type III pantothenate kinase [Alistipes sp.]
MNLIVDIGNTSIKLAVMDRGACVAERRTERLLPAMLDELFAAHAVDKAIVCSSRGDASEIVAMIRPRVERLVEFAASTPVPVASDYLTPETLGRDRLAAAVGAATLYPGREVLVVDCGTAVTFDRVSADGRFRGGCISPGLRMRLRALHDYTASLPLCDITEDEELVGLTTRQAIERGVMNSLVFEIEGYVSRMQGKIDGLCVIFTGGDAKCLAKRIKNTIFADRNLVFCGLDRILEFNASEEHLE